MPILDMGQKKPVSALISCVALDKSLDFSVFHFPITEMMTSIPTFAGHCHRHLSVTVRYPGFLLFRERGQLRSLMVTESRFSSPLRCMFLSQPSSWL